MTTLHLLATDSPYLAALVVALVIGAIGILIWASLPEPGNADIERQCQSLRRHADHAVQHRPRVPAARPKACGRGLCRHLADCSDVYCPGRSGPDHHAGR